MNKNGLFWILTIFVVAGGGYLVAKFVSPEGTPVSATPAKAKVEISSSNEGSRTVARPAKDLKLDIKNNIRPDLYRDLIQSLYSFDWNVDNKISMAFCILLEQLVSTANSIVFFLIFCF